jgi:segregation and condensation protein A
MEAILKRLHEEGPVSLADLFTPPRTRGRLVGLFLAILELIKGRRVSGRQGEAFGDIVLCLAPPADAGASPGPAAGKG